MSDLSVNTGLELPRDTRLEDYRERARRRLTINVDRDPYIFEIMGRPDQELAWDSLDSVFESLWRTSDMTEPNEPRRPPFHSRPTVRRRPERFGEVRDLFFNLEEFRWERMGLENFRRNINRAQSWEQPEYAQVAFFPRSSPGRIILFEDISFEKYVGRTCGK